MHLSDPIPYRYPRRLSFAMILDANNSGRDYARNEEQNRLGRSNQRDFTYLRQLVAMQITAEDSCNLARDINTVIRLRERARKTVPRLGTNNSLLFRRCCNNYVTGYFGLVNATLETDTRDVGKRKYLRWVNIFSRGVLKLKQD